MKKNMWFLISLFLLASVTLTIELVREDIQVHKPAHRAADLFQQTVPAASVNRAAGNQFIFKNGMPVAPTNTANELSNVIVQNGAVAFRLHDPYASEIDSIRFYVINHSSGYSSGTGGIPRVRVYADQNGQCVCGTNANLLGLDGHQAIDAAFPNPSSGKGAFVFVPFDASAYTATQGWFWFVITNDDLAPTANYFSVDFLRDSRNATAPATEMPWGQVYGWNASTQQWGLIPYLFPAPVAVGHLDLNVFGNGYIEYENGALVCGTEYGFPQSLCP